MMHVAAIVIPCLTWLLLSGGSIALGARLLTASSPEPFAVRVARELENPDADLRAALREVDRIGYLAPPVAVPEPTEIAPCWCCPPGSVHVPSDFRRFALPEPEPRKPALVQPEAAYQYQAGALAGAAAISGQSAAQVDAMADQRPWFWPYAQAMLSDGSAILREQFGSGRVSREWLDDHRHDIVQALRRL